MQNGKFPGQTPHVLKKEKERKRERREKWSKKRVPRGDETKRDSDEKFTKTKATFCLIN